MGEWGQWAACSRPCLTHGQPQGTQTRTRKVVVRPAGVSVQCPLTAATQECNPIPCASPDEPNSPQETRIQRQVTVLV
jgi:hypothetical protein